VNAAPELTLVRAKAKEGTNDAKDCRLWQAGIIIIIFAECSETAIMEQEGNKQWYGVDVEGEEEEMHQNDEDER
jgi:hypothetical protein